MTSPEGLIELSLAEFARAVASRRPIPGSGSVAAAVGALGAGLASMALASAPGEEEASSALAALQARLLACVDADAAAYQAFVAARRAGAAPAALLERSIAVPREIAELSLAALEQLTLGFPAVRMALHSECVTAAQALLAAIEGATFTADTNLSELESARERAERSFQHAGLRERARALAREQRAADARTGVRANTPPQA